jgi:putative membrane protein
MHALTLALIALAALWYAAGVRRLWRRAGRGRGIARAQAASFGTGIALLALAVLSPLHEAAERLLWVHMVQHELLMVVAAPLLVLGRPMQAFAHVVPLRVPRILGDPLPAFGAHALAVWLWHMPSLFDAALASEAWHFAQHASFLASALLFWWTIAARADLAALASLFGTMVYTGALGALLAFARAPWYPGFSLEDQQLAGLIMWVPAGLAYPAGALLIASRWLQRSAA